MLGSVTPIVLNWLSEDKYLQYSAFLIYFLNEG